MQCTTERFGRIPTNIGLLSCILIDCVIFFFWHGIKYNIDITQRQHSSYSPWWTKRLYRVWNARNYSSTEYSWRCDKRKSFLHTCKKSAESLGRSASLRLFMPLYFSGLKKPLPFEHVFLNLHSCKLPPSTWFHAGLSVIHTSKSIWKPTNVSTQLQSELNLLNNA